MVELQQNHVDPESDPIKMGVLTKPNRQAGNKPTQKDNFPMFRFNIEKEKYLILFINTFKEFWS